MLTIQQHVDLFPYNTFKIKASAKYFTVIHSVEEAEELFQSDLFKNERHLLLGGGSNILFTSDFSGLVVKVELKGRKLIQEDDERVTIQVGAGENWHEFVVHCVDQNWGGIENLSLIPGTVGAAPMQNIGAYGAEIKKNILAVNAIKIPEGVSKIFSHTACEFGYRESIFKNKLKSQYLISSITLTLTKKNHQFITSYGALEETLKQNGVETPSVKAISDAVIQIRRSKLPDPAVIGNAGSFFKNPSIDADLAVFLKKKFPDMPSFPEQNNRVKIPAAWLIEQCGWKGKTFDTIGVHRHQALVLVNYGGGEGKKIYQLALEILASVKEKFNITLHPEVNMIA